ncbi:MAG: TIGR00159 family protein [Provencibacterium sp.]|jgi:diadenylate cyclase|nr:TIGR00159 family protein [Provencibacterium sp.]
MFSEANVTLQDTLSNIWATIKTISPGDVIDILMVAVVLYYIIKLVRDTRASQLVKGIMLLLCVYLFTDMLEFKVMGFFMKTILTVGATALIVVFQPELRRALERMGRTRLPSGLFGAGAQGEEQRAAILSMIEEVCEASKSLSRHKIGALMVFEMQTRLGEIIKTGTLIDCKPVAELIGNIFFPNAPLHDGAMIIRDARLHAAGCFLPLTENNELSKELGTRHRASLGMSENSDAIVVVVSEETGTISVARNGVLTRNYTPETLGNYLRTELLGNEVPREKEHRFKRKKAKS